MKYMPHLDSLRAVAVIFVITQHWYSKVPVIEWFTRFKLGKMGVLLFFVLSGFLITQILLKNRESYFDGSESLGSILRIFYLRRSLRIFPLYYLSLIVFYLGDFNGMQEKIAYYVFYGSNILIYQNQQWDGATGPYWSLAVEEQFYFIWPLLILTCKARWLKMVLLIGVLTGPISRLCFYFLAQTYLESAKPSYAMVLMPSCLDSFAMGALLAYARLENWRHFICWIENRFVFLLSLMLSLCCFFFRETYVFLVFFPAFFSLFSVCVIHQASGSIAPVFFGSRLIFNRVTRGLGRVSYGLYIYHCCIWWIYGNLFFIQNKYLPIEMHWLKESTQYANGVWEVLQFIMLLVVAITSWTLIEKPILRFKPSLAHRK